jgi:hypothetical protein
VMNNLMNVMKKLTKNYAPKKAPIFSQEDLHALLFTDLLSDDDPTELEAKVLSAMMHFGLLQKNEVLKLHYDDLTIPTTNNNITVNFHYPQKTTTEPSNYNIPAQFKSSLQKYLDQIPKNMKKKTASYCSHGTL